ncbi:probable S-adenosylmethionine-dependent methyltransferase [Natronomonas moolapensis 8.8.11]|uniref:Probable S-adenosylmethionine-dependent methyltransferase n=1 Tax=Natronomonas moolapensis (strain DSM 18674 / CECT 7526 / JCM 14361 / 8.8.11) TaxID=268739 RepID=M1XTN7_NATM8|nr:methyltransferase domain-containing protein [Natronomonas moolapensis]CCQ37804.1 probable S-adenosylmethionine-dependent methyltransferase [Natronomonas moolapensis 8.8.11]
MRRFDAEYLRETRRGMWADSREALADLSIDDCERVVDVGCGEGALTRVLREECPGEVVGCDRDARLLAELEGPTVRGDAYRLPFADGSVDLVACQALLINLPDPGRAVREFARVAADRVACIEPDNAAVGVESTVEAEPALARRARERYLEGVDTDVALGADAADVFRAAGLSNVRTRRYEQALVVEPPYTDSEVEAIGRKASGAGLRERRGSMAGTEEALDSLRAEWREMGRTAVAQLARGAYRREETVPFYIVVGES